MKGYQKNTERHSWTKDEIKSIIGLWESESKESLASKLRVEVNQLMYMVNAIREQGFKLTRKTKKGVTAGLIKEAIAELKSR